MPQAFVVVFRCKTSSQNPDDWEPVKPADTPEWVTSEINTGRMLDGMTITQHESEYWYRAERVDAPAGETLQ